MSGSGSNFLSYFLPKPYGKGGSSSGGGGGDGIKRFNSPRDVKSKESSSTTNTIEIEEKRKPHVSDPIVFTTSVFTPIKFDQQPHNYHQMNYNLPPGTSGKKPSHQYPHPPSLSPSPSPAPPSLILKKSSETYSDESSELNKRFQQQRNLQNLQILPPSSSLPTKSGFMSSPSPVPSNCWEFTLKKNALSPATTPTPTISTSRPHYPDFEFESSIQNDPQYLAEIAKKQSAKRRNRRKSLTNSAEIINTSGGSNSKDKNGSLTTTTATTSSTFNSTSSSDSEPEMTKIRREKRAQQQQMFQEHQERVQAKKKKKKRRKSKNFDHIEVKVDVNPPPLPAKPPQMVHQQQNYSYQRFKSQPLPLPQPQPQVNPSNYHHSYGLSHEQIQIPIYQYQNQNQNLYHQDQDYPIVHADDPNTMYNYYNENDYHIQYSPYGVDPRFNHYSNYNNPTSFDQVDSTAMTPTRIPMSPVSSMNKMNLNNSSNMNMPPPSPFMDQTMPNNGNSTYAHNFYYNYTNDYEYQPPEEPDLNNSNRNPRIRNGNINTHSSSTNRGNDIKMSKFPLANSQSAPHIIKRNGVENVGGDEQHDETAAEFLSSNLGFPVRRLSSNIRNQFSSNSNGHHQYRSTPSPVKKPVKSILKYKDPIESAIVQALKKKNSQEMASVLSKNRKNLKKAVDELEKMYQELGLSDEDLLDRAERRDLPTEHQLLRHAPSLPVGPPKINGSTGLSGSTQSMSIDSSNSQNEKESFTIEDVGDENWNSLWSKDKDKGNLNGQIFKFKTPGSDEALYSCLRTPSGASILNSALGSRIRAPPLRRSGISDKFNDDMARRRWTSLGGGSNLELHRFDGNTGGESPSQFKKHFLPYQQSYLALSPVALSPTPYSNPGYYSPSPLTGHKNENYCPQYQIPYSPQLEYYEENPELILDDMTYRNNKRANSIRIIDSQPPFEIPNNLDLNSSIPAPNSDYLHLVPKEKHRPLYRHLKHPDIIKDDLGFRNLRKDTSTEVNLNTTNSTNGYNTHKLWDTEKWKNPSGVVLRRHFPNQGQNVSRSGSVQARPVSSYGSLENIRKYYNPFYFDYDDTDYNLGTSKKRVVHLQDEISRWNSMTELERLNAQKKRDEQIQLRPPPANPSWQKRTSASKIRPSSTYNEPSWVEQIELMEMSMKLVEEQKRRVEKKKKIENREVGDGCEDSARPFNECQDLEPNKEKIFIEKSRSTPVMRKPWTDVLLESFNKPEETNGDHLSKIYQSSTDHDIKCQKTSSGKDEKVQDLVDTPLVRQFCRPTTLTYNENQEK